jgi:hypothetical protein
VVNALVLLGLTTVGGFFGAFLNSYFRTKGENLATHEDIGKLVDQVRAVTTTTKEIEAKISSDVWDRQKRWELRRDAVIDALQKMGAIEEALWKLRNVHVAASQDNDPTRFSEHRVKALESFNAARDQLDRSCLTVCLVCGENLRDELLVFSKYANNLAKDTHQGQPDAFLVWHDDFVDRSNAIMESMRSALKSA